MAEIARNKVKSAVIFIINAVSLDTTVLAWLNIRPADIARVVREVPTGLSIGIPFLVYLVTLIVICSQTMRAHHKRLQGYLHIRIPWKREIFLFANVGFWVAVALFYWR